MADKDCQRFHAFRGESERWQKPFAPRPPGGSSWLMSLADLCFLMLTFCVLVFSMSVPNWTAWTSLIQGLNLREDVMVPHPVQETSPQRAASTYDPPLGDDLRYIEALLAQAARDNPDLQKIVRQRVGGTTTLFLPPEIDSGSLQALAPILDRLPNKVAVETSVILSGATDEAAYTLWREAMQSSLDVAMQLQNSGYTWQITPLVHMAYGQEPGDRDRSTQPSVQTVGIVLVPEAKE